jgi:hypothetical protein
MYQVPCRLLLRQVIATLLPSCARAENLNDVTTSILWRHHSVVRPRTAIDPSQLRYD